MRGRTSKPTGYLTLLSAVLGQVNVQQYSENEERALPTNSNILEKKQDITAVQEGKVGHCTGEKMAGY